MSTTPKLGTVTREEKKGKQDPAKVWHQYRSLHGILVLTEPKSSNELLKPMRFRSLQSLRVLAQGVADVLNAGPRDSEVSAQAWQYSMSTRLYSVLNYFDHVKVVTSANQPNEPMERTIRIHVQHRVTQMRRVQRLDKAA